jgi:hypothetical protein
MQTGWQLRMRKEISVYEIREFIIQLTKLPTGPLPEQDSVHIFEIHSGTSRYNIILPYKRSPKSPKMLTCI